MRGFLPALLLASTLALPACSVVSALSGQSTQGSAAVYSLDQAYVVADGVIANAINSGLVKNAATVAALKKGSQTVHDALKAASQSEEAGKADAETLYVAARNAVISFEASASAAGITLPAAAQPPAQ